MIPHPDLAPDLTQHPHTVLNPVDPEGAQALSHPSAFLESLKQPHPLGSLRGDFPTPLTPTALQLRRLLNATWLGPLLLLC